MTENKKRLHIEEPEPPAPVTESTFSTAFMTYRIGLAEIAKLGEDPENFFAQTVFTQRTDNSEVVSLLDRGLVDAVMVKACWLEAQPAEVQNRYRVLAPRYGGVNCKHSTDTYPGIMMAVTQGAHPIIAHVIARTILSHPLLPDGHRWAVTTDMRAVDNVYRLLKIENYAYLREMTLQRWLETYWQVPAFIALLLLGLALHGWRTSVLVTSRLDRWFLKLCFHKNLLYCAYLFIKIYEKSRSRAVRRGFD